MRERERERERGEERRGGDSNVFSAHGSALQPSTALLVLPAGHQEVENKLEIRNVLMVETLPRHDLRPNFKEDFQFDFI